MFMARDALISAYKTRRNSGSKKTPFNYGILLASDYVSTLAGYVGPDYCNKIAAKSRGSFDDLMRKAARTLVYSNEDMLLLSKGIGQESVELPKNCLVAFRHVLTSNRKDRDGDVLHPDGAMVDPKMLLLWQHVHTLPIGKMLRVSSQDKNKLEIISCIVDMNALCHDAAVMIDNGMGRYSHGFRALEFTETKADHNGMGGGFDVTKFEIMEASLVSVPANVDAQTEEVLLSLVEGGKLTSPLMKRVGAGIREKRPLQVAGVKIRYRERLGDYSKEIACDSLTDLKAAVDAGLIGDSKHENEPGNRDEAGGKVGTGASEKADAETADGETKVATDKEVACPECDWVGSMPDDGTCPECGAELEPTTVETDEEKSGSKSLADSWEWVRDELSRQSKPYLQLMNIAVPQDTSAWIYAMFSDHALVQLFNYAVGSITNPTFYELDWQVIDGTPRFTGEPRQVDVTENTEVVTRTLSLLGEATTRKQLIKSIPWVDVKPYPYEYAVKITDPSKYEKIWCQNNKFGDGINAIFGVLKDGKVELQSIHFDNKQFTIEEAKKWLEEHEYKTSGFEESAGKSTLTIEKAGRVLSSANERRIGDAMNCHKETLKLGEGHLSAPARALVKEAHGHLSEVVSSLGKDEGKSTDLSLKDMMAAFFVKATPDDRKQMIEILTALDKADLVTGMAEQYSALLG
jgi:hypothetical protein